ncbi:hypothetical protein [Croceitalea rosinachiae]|uniref:Uncharacterized protein n=1 Tax=Croceitalea rosinachiae TaxID=3075596 RepID=A0ABU3AEF1_9FLAO|nr:hypothetical protein [Croceitalea sp. F388]MDT0607453.1 hypothetical protein [Croceitalea sp. F388]
MKDFFKIISLLSFVILMFIKVSSFHVYSHVGHDDDTSIENCSSCELAIEHQQTAFIAPATISLEKKLIGEDFSAVETYYQSFTLQIASSDFFSRPPPFVV